MTWMLRAQPDAPCTTVLADGEWRLVHPGDADCSRPRQYPFCGAGHSLDSATGRLSRRKGDGAPGVTVIWRGWQRPDALSMWLILDPLLEIWVKLRCVVGIIPIMLQAKPCYIAYKLRESPELDNQRTFRQRSGASFMCNPKPGLKENEMNTTMAIDLNIGADVHRRDDKCGKLTKVVIDPDTMQSEEYCRRGRFITKASPRLAGLTRSLLLVMRPSISHFPLMN